MSHRFITSSIVSALLLFACGGSEVVVGKTDTSDQKLQTTKDGGATGNGATCSWANTALYDQYGNSAPVPTYGVGDQFKSIDGCNDCACTDKGIMCTIRTCAPQQCTTEAKVCPDGKTSVGRTGPNCSFAPCPGDVACTDDAKKCPDGTYVGRTGPHCEFAACPNNACPALAKQCPDGSYATASGPNCDFVCPPASCEALQKNAGDKLRAAIDANATCQVDADCMNVAVAADCVSQCTRAIAKTGEDDFKQAVDSANQSICPDFKKQGCTLTYPPCVAPQTPRCVNNKCQ